MAIQLLSYNSRGFNEFKGDYLNTLASALNTDFICVQEHMRLRENVGSVQKELKSFNSTFIPAVQSNTSIISAGRASGGLGLLWKRSLDKLVNIVRHPNSYRVHAVTFDSKFLIVNTYFPVDPRTNTFDDFELVKTLEDITWYINTFPNLVLIIAGDINCDFSRNTRFVNIIREFMMRNNLMTVWSAYPVDFTHSGSINNSPYFSCIDHFLIKTVDCNKVLEAQVIHTGDNLSDHDPIYMKFSTDHVIEADIQHSKSSNPRPSWRKASDQDIKNYREDLQSRLSRVTLSEGIICNNPNCVDINHHKDIDVFSSDLLRAIDDSVKSKIPSSRTYNSEKVVPGWSSSVKPFQDDANFWHSIWLSCGKPRDCELHNLMKRTRNAYHLAVRKVKKNRAKIQQDKMVDSLLNGGTSNLLQELKAQRLGNSNNVASKIDGHSGSENIANHFSTIYSKLYSKNKSDQEMKDFLIDLNSNIGLQNLSEVENVTPQVVYQAICSLHNNKSDNSFDWKSDALLKGSDILADSFTLLFQSFLLHGYVPNSLLTCSLQPIVKDNLGDKFSSDNYRAIGISPLVLKVLDLVILLLFANELKPCELQFGFQKKNSPTMCTWLVSETVNYFNNRDTPVFSCFLDISKAFDLVNFYKLFQKLKFKISPLFVRLLSYIYMRQVCKVNWNNEFSSEFLVHNGVRQGAVLSPTLFSVYIDELFMILKNSGFGCYVNEIFYGITGYADDLVLLSPSIYGLQRMIDLTNDYLLSLGLSISVNFVNPQKSKTKCIAFGLKHDPLPVNLNGINLPWCDTYEHLGHLLYKDGTLKRDCDLKRRSFIGQFHALRQEIKYQKPIVFLKLINIYLSHFYGSNLWNLFDCDSLYVTWNNVIRNIFNLPKRSHRYLIEPVSEFPHLKCMLTNRFMKFFLSLYNSDKTVIKNLVNTQFRDARSTFGANVLNLCIYNNDFNPFNFSKNMIKYHEIPVDEIWRVGLIKEILHILDYEMDLNFDKSHLGFILNYVAES